MAMNEKFYAEALLGMFTTSFLPADGAVAKALFANSSAEGVIVKSINVSSTDSIQYFELSINDGNNTFVLGTIPVPANSGTSTTGAVTSVNLLDGALIRGLERDICGNYIVKLAPGYTLYGRMIGAVNSGKQISIVGSYAKLTAV